MKTAISVALAAAVGTVTAQQSAYGQCGGQGWTGATTCIAGYTCNVVNAYYYQCLPGTTTLATSTRATATTTSAGQATATTSGKVRFGGVNIAGFDFGCATSGTCNVSQAYPPLRSLGGVDGAGQMSHFVNDDHLNVFRLPVGWQYLVDSPGAALNPTRSANYDSLVQTCLATGASCIIDIHNYARWNGAIIGQGGPTDAQFASLWSQLATKYANNNKVIFGIMNEPHDIPNIQTWANTVQAVVTAIRTAGATSNMILMPGTDYSSAQTLVSSGAGPALLAVTNLDKTTTNLFFDVHKYLDSDNSGTHTECVTNNIDSAFAPLATWLRTNKRQAILTETGGGNTQSCLTYMCQQLDFLNANSDVYLGWTGWSAGGFDSTYELTETPTLSGSTWTDTALVKGCVAAKFQ